MAPSTATATLYGSVTLVTVSTGLRARRVGSTIRQRNMRSSVEMASDQMWIATTIAVTTAMFVRYGSVTRPVREYETYGDQNGAHHVKVSLGWNSKGA